MSKNKRRPSQNAGVASVLHHRHKVFSMSSRHLRLIICLSLVVATLAVYWQVRNHDFVNYDDDTYVTKNSHIQKGLTSDGLKWAFTTIHANFWHLVGNR